MAKSEAGWAQVAKNADMSEWSDTDDEKEKKDYTEKSATAYTTACNAYSQWVDSDKNEVALNHQYTHDGLTKLVAAVWSVAESHGIDVSAWSEKKQKIKSIADELQIDPMSTDHADITRKAFEMTAKMISAIQEEKGSDHSEKAVSKLTTAAHAINPDELMTDQADEIYDFFTKANNALQSLSGHDDSMSTSASSENDE